VPTRTLAGATRDLDAPACLYAQCAFPPPARLVFLLFGRFGRHRRQT
jgi:hypothetical protein